MRVYCKHCEHEKDVDDCWCVIDTRIKERYFECKIKCNIQAVISQKEEESRGAIEIDTATEDWMDRIPKKTWIEWFSSFFGLSGIRYIKVKTN